MSASSEAPLDPAEQQRTLRLLDQLADLLASDPQAVADQTAALLPLLKDRFPDPAYGWALALRAQACRFVDDLSGVLDAVSAGELELESDSQFAAQLHLEAGMALNQFGRQSEGLAHLRQSLKAFRAQQDESGEAWVLVSIADSLAGLGYPEDPLPLLELAIEKAGRLDDDYVRRRAFKQKAVALRHRGQVVDALAAISTALEGQPDGHSKANFQLERGHLLTMSGQYAAADDDFLAAEAVYAEAGDLLGLGNCARALATNALILGRNREGLRHLDVATDAYRRLDNPSGLGYALRERALVRMAEGDGDGARSDAEEGTAAFRRSGDLLGLAGMLRTAARIAQVRGEVQTAKELLDQASDLVADGGNPLAEAGILLTRAEIGRSPANRLEAAGRAADLYSEMGVEPGRAHALTYRARAQYESEEPEAALASLRQSRDAWMRARVVVTDPARRADHDFALRDVISNALQTAADIGNREAQEFAADLLLADAPLGLRRVLRTGDIGGRPRRIIERSKAPGVGPRGSHSRGALLQQLSFALSTLDVEVQGEIIGAGQLADQHPGAAVLVVGSPTRHSEIPIAWAMPEQPVRFQLSPIDTGHVDAIDALGLALSLERTDALWRPEHREWQTTLVEPLLSAELLTWLDAHRPAELVAVLAPVLSHLRLEALLVSGEPLGVLAAVRRVPVLAPGSLDPAVQAVSAYLDPALSWAAERHACPEAASDPAVFREELGERRLIVAGCHGTSATGVQGTLCASDGTPVLDAIDLLSQSLAQSVVVLEACFSGRYLGARTGEQLNLATVALLAGASEVVAGLIALPAGDATTGRIAGPALQQIRAGVCAPEALRRARAEYWSRAEGFVAVPSADPSSAATMPADAPWAWAGLCSYSR